MKITTDHAASSYGQPVILDNSGEVMRYSSGVRAVRLKLGLTLDELAAACGVSRRTVEGWESGRMPQTAALNVMADLLRRRRKPSGPESTDRKQRRPTLVLPPGPGVAV